MIWMKLNNKDELINTTNVNDMEKNHNLWMSLNKHIMCMILTTSFTNENNCYLYVIYGNVDEIRPCGKWYFSPTNPI